MKPMLPLPPTLALLALAAVVPVFGQGTPAVRYYITTRPGLPIPHTVLVQEISALAVSSDPGERDGILADVDYPQFGYNGVAARLTTAQFAQLDTARFRAFPDFPIQPNSSPAGPLWATNQFNLPDNPSPCPATPTVYMVDTGILPSHPDLQWPPANPVITFKPGLSFGYNVALDPAVLLPPYQDPHDHGTRLTGCLGGVGGGLLGALGGKAQVKSVVIYDAPAEGPLNTFVSQAINGVLGSVADHQARLALPYLKNHASVLLFAHSTPLSAGRFADLDRAVEIAWESGLHVVMSAGNEGAPAVRVSPAGAAWGYTNGTGSSRFWFGDAPTGAGFYRAVDAFLVTGAYQQNIDTSLQIWPGSNNNIAGADVLDGFAPGVAVPTPILFPAAAISNGTGTSYSAAYTAALATWTAGQKPWASPADLRTWLRDDRVAMPGGLRYQTPDLPDITFPYSSWIHHFYPLPVSPSGADAPLADPDNDGVVNMIEYYCGMDPRFHDATLRPVIQANTGMGGTALQILLPRACWLGETPQVAWTLQRSTDLLEWTPVTLTTFAATGALPVGDAPPWEATATVSPLLQREFFRLRFHATVPL